MSHATTYHHEPIPPPLVTAASITTDVVASLGTVLVAVGAIATFEGVAVVGMAGENPFFIALVSLAIFLGRQAAAKIQWWYRQEVKIAEQAEQAVRDRVRIETLEQQVRRLLDQIEAIRDEKLKLRAELADVIAKLAQAERTPDPD